MRKKSSNLEPGCVLISRTNLVHRLSHGQVSRFGRCCHCLVPDRSPGSFSASGERRLRDAAAAASFRPQWPAVWSLSPLIRLHSTSIWRVVDRAVGSWLPRNLIVAGSMCNFAFQIKVWKAHRGRFFYFEADAGNWPVIMTSLDVSR